MEILSAKLSMSNADETARQSFVCPSKFLSLPILVPTKHASTAGPSLLQTVNAAERFQTGFLPD